MIEKILVAVAGRGLCEQMVNMLMEIPSIQRASVTVLHIVSPKVVSGDMADKLEEGGKILAEAVKSMKIDPSKVNPRLKQGDPKIIVPEVAKEENADLIIMGSRALGRLQAILQNSVSQYVFQLASRPMLLVKDDIYVKRIKRIMVAMDSSDESKQALEMAIYMARDISNCEIIMTRIGSKLPDKPEDDPVLAQAIKEVKRYRIKYRCILKSGKAGPIICELAYDLNANLLIVGSPDRRPSIAKSLVDLDRLLGGSVSDYVRVKADCPVLLVRR